MTREELLVSKHGTHLTLSLVIDEMVNISNDKLSLKSGLKRKATTQVQQLEATIAELNAVIVGKFNGKNKKREHFDYLGNAAKVYSYASMNEVPEYTMVMWKKHGIANKVAHASSTCRKGKCWMNDTVQGPPVIKEFMKHL